MTPLTAARAQMEVSLGFHMIFAALGIGLPLLMVLAELQWVRTGAPHWRDLARRWSRATALLFVVGAVSGTALSFELGLLWPRFMQAAGPVIGPGFALEGFAFFVEAIFLGMHLYGWERLSPRAHLAAGVAVAFSGMLSGVLVLAVNAWMQQPAGFALEGGRAVSVDPTAVFLTPRWFDMALHSTLACYASVGFATAGVYAYAIAKGEGDARHRGALRLALLVGGVAAVLQPMSGHLTAERAGRFQPAKLAAMEALFTTTAHAPLLVGGIPDVAAREVRYGLHLPSGLSMLLHLDPAATVTGLDRVPRDQWPNVVVSHLAFDVMVGAGFAMMAVALAALYLHARRGGVEAHPRMLKALVLAAPLGFIALEAGWVVSEVGRQPWVIYGVMRTADAVTPRTDVAVTFWTFTALYAGLGAALVVLLRRLARTPVEDDAKGHGDAPRAEESHADA
ncbi:MAG: cytochrome ubiquinol oxidase subunit I [Polyangiales bacterium]